MNKKFKEVRILDCSHSESIEPRIVSYIESVRIKENYKFEFVYSRTIDKIKAMLTTSIKNIKCNESITDKRDMVYTPTTLEELIKALENTVITDNNINVYCEGAPITMDRKTHNIPFVFDKNIQFGEFIDLVATQFEVNEELPRLKALRYKIFVENNIKSQTEEDALSK